MNDRVTPINSGAPDLLRMGNTTYRAKDSAEILSHAPHSLDEPLPADMQLPSRKRDDSLLPTSDFIHGKGEPPHCFTEIQNVRNGDEYTRLIHCTDGLSDHQPVLAASHYRTSGDEIPPLRRVLLVTMPVFSAYASFITFQSPLKVHMGITDKRSESTCVFGVTLSMFLLGALLFRFMHNVFLGFLTPRKRIYFAQSLLCFSLWLIVVTYYVIGSKSLIPVFFAYIGGGVAVGTFESSFISVITPLGHVTKKWALYGMPLGYNAFAICGLILLGLIPTNPLLQGIAFGVVGAFNLLGLIVFLCFVPDTPFESSEESFTSFLRKLKKGMQWIPLFWKNMACMFVNMFTVTLGSSLIQYIFGKGEILLAPTSKLPTNFFQALVAVFTFSGDFLSRRLAYDPPSWYPRKILLASAQTGNPVRFLLLNIVGFGCCVSKIAFLAPIGMFLTMFSNGSIYSSTMRLIDNHVENQFNLAAISMFLFAGDSGSYVASLVFTPVLNLL